MLSVLIPIYDWDLSEMVTELHRQLIRSKVPFEILISDNAQESVLHTKNQQLNQLENVAYMVESEHVGRSANRNYLADLSKYDWLLFLDGDTAVTNPCFIANYLDSLPQNVVVCGGTAYLQQPPKNSDKMLRWRYGRKKESMPLKIRKQNPYKTYSSFNFLIRKDIFHQVRFNDNLTQYGHEDTLFGQELKHREIPIHHIDNPLIHLGLDTTAIFVEKTKIAVQNLKYLIEKEMIDSDIRLFRYYNRLRQLGLVTHIAQQFERWETSIEKNLKSHHPNLFLFDCFKLFYLCALMTNTTK